MSSEVQVLDQFGRPLSEARSIENPNIPITTADDWLEAFGGGTRTSAGVFVGRSRGLTHSAVWRAVDLISSTAAKTPIKFYRNGPNGRERWDDHQNVNVVCHEPNPLMTSFIFWRAVLLHVLTSGVAYAAIFRAPNGRVMELMLLDPTWVEDLTAPTEIVHKVTVPSGPGREGVTSFVRGADMLHFKGMTWDGVTCLSPIAFHREEIGAGLAMREHGGRFFGNGAHPGLALQHPATLGETAKANIEKQFARKYGGVTNAFRTMVLEEGMTANPFHWSAEDTQFIESMQFNLIDIANIFGLPPHKLGDSTRTSFASLEQENQAFLDSMDPWFVMVEAELRRKLLSAEAKATGSTTIEYLRESVVRVDLDARTKALTASVGGMPWMTINEARAVVNLPKIEGGDELHQGPSGQPPPGQAAPEPPPEESEDEPEEDENDEAARAVRHLLDATMARMGTRLHNRIARARKRTDYEEWRAENIGVGRDRAVTDSLEAVVRVECSLNGGSVNDRVAYYETILYNEVDDECSE